MQRRSFLLSSAAGMVVPRLFATAGVQHEERSDFPPDRYEAPAWLRYAKAVYFDGYTPPVYPRIDDFDAKRLVEQCVLAIGGDTLRFQPIGYWAIYPSKAFPNHPDLGERDLIAETAHACRTAGVSLYCYAGYGHPALELSWVERHPEYANWLRIGPDGKPSREVWWHMGWAPRQPMCKLGDAYRSAIREVVRELCAHDIDGIYFDSPSAYYGVCFCQACRSNYREVTGLDLDRLKNPSDLEALVAWQEWVRKCTREDLLAFRGIIHRSGKFMLCHNSATWQGRALPLQYRIPDGFMVEHADQIYERLMHGMMGASMARPYKKLSQMYVGSHSLASDSLPTHNEPHAKHNATLEDAFEIRMEGFANLSAGGVPIYATANRLYYGIGSGSTEPAREIFGLMRRAESIIKDSVPVPYVSIVPTWESLQRWRTGQTTWNWEMSKGFFLAMLDSRISVDVRPNTEMSEEWLNQQHVVALCGASGISDGQAAMLAGWVGRGGGLLATYDTGLYNEKGQLRKDGGVLKEILGVEIQGEPLPAMPECYYRIQISHPSLGQYEKGSIIEGDNQLLPVVVRDGATSLADCWNLGTGESRGPAIIANQYGKGRAIYVNGSLENLYSCERVASTQRMLASMVRYLGGDAPLPFKLSAPAGVYGVLRRTISGDVALWVLAPVGFKDEAAGRMRQQFLPVENVEARILVPEQRQVQAVRLLRAGRNVPFNLSGSYAVVTIPVLHIAELVHVAF